MLWGTRNIKWLNAAYLLNAVDWQLVNCQHDLELETLAWFCVFLSSWSHHHEQADRRGKTELTDKGRRRQKLENRKLLYFGIRWVRYLTFDFESKSKKGGVLKLPAAAM